MLLLKTRPAAEPSSPKVTQLQRRDRCLRGHSQELSQRAAAAPKSGVKGTEGDGSGHLRAVPGHGVTCQAGLAGSSCKTHAQRLSRDLLAFCTHQA